MYFGYDSTHNVIYDVPDRDVELWAERYEDLIIFEAELSEPGTNEKLEELQKRINDLVDQVCMVREEAAREDILD